jgi:hypothetical protein
MGSGREIKIQVNLLAGIDKLSHQGGYRVSESSTSDSVKRVAFEEQGVV